MNKWAPILLTLLTSAFLCNAQGVANPALQSDSDFIEHTYFPAVTLLYSQTEAGEMRMHCTATSFEQVEGGYLFATAAHCAVDDDEKSLTHGKIKNMSYFVTLDENVDVKTFLKASVVACGYQIKGDDFCIFHVKTTHNFPVVPLGEDSVRVIGEEVVNVASPEGLGKQVFFGRISMPKLDRTVVVDDLNWTHTVLLQLPGTNEGSSGSSVICLKQHAICAFLVGTIAGTTMVAVPVSKFKIFLDSVKTCKVKNYIVNTNAEEGSFYHCPEDKEGTWPNQ